MTTYILIALIVGIGAGIFYRPKGKAGHGGEEKHGGAAQNAERPELVELQAKEKAENLEKILGLFIGEPNGKLRNDGVEKFLDVSDATATRYLEELEKQGKIKQVGKEGRYVYYELAK